MAVVAAAGIGCSAQSPVAPSGSAAFASSGPSSSSPSGSLSMAANDWKFEYSPNMPRHPRSAGSGWQFDFPTKQGVGYLTTSQRPSSASEAIEAAITIETQGSPFFEFRTEASNTCPGQANVRLYFQRRGDDMSGKGGYEFYRWWSNPVAYDLDQGSVRLVGDLTDPAAWTSVFGRRGSEHEAEFRAALADLGAVGFTFGGGCFFGHGVYVAPGTGGAVFTATSFTIR